LGEDGALYGTTSVGGGGDCSDLGVDGCGTVFKLTPPDPPRGTWTETVLYRFQGGTDGAIPSSSLVLGDDGALYGATFNGGDSNCYVDMFTPPSRTATTCGTIFKLTPPRGLTDGWTERVIYTFHGGANGGTPIGDLNLRHGALYGATMGNFFAPDFSLLSSGTVFRLSAPVTPMDGWSAKTLYNFLDGSSPNGGVTVREGAIYGVTGGTVFELTRPATPGSMWTRTTLHQFQFGTTDGQLAFGDLVSGQTGIFYGVTIGGGKFGHGTVWQLAPPAIPDGPWVETILHDFPGGNGGDQPNSLIQVEGGSLYGTTGQSFGTAFKLVP
jgi:hypothetical protein